MSRGATTAAGPAGYSGKPLPEKLGYKAGQHALFIGLPTALASLPASTRFASIAQERDWDAALPGGAFDLIHAFTMRGSDLDGGLARLRAALRPEGMIWVSWPKKAAKVATDVTEDRIRDAALAGDLVDVKVAAIDAVWSGLKLVIRKALR